MSKFDGYHTALVKQTPYGRPSNSISFDDGVAFRYDLFSMTFPPAFEACDVFYSDLPWRSGFDDFERRAEKSGRRYGDFLKCVSAHIERYGKPTVMVTGKHAIGALRPDRVYDTRLNGNPASALCWNFELERTASEREILAEISSRFDIGGDFCCGYGRTALAFRDAGKQFVVSDYNGTCLGYIEDHL